MRFSPFASSAIRTTALGLLLWNIETLQQGRLVAWLSNIRIIVMICSRLISALPLALRLVIESWDPQVGTDSDFDISATDNAYCQDVNSG